MRDNTAKMIQRDLRLARAQRKRDQEARRKITREQRKAAKQNKRDKAWGKPAREKRGGLSWTGKGDKVDKWGAPEKKPKKEKKKDGFIKRILAFGRAAPRDPVQWTDQHEQIYQQALAESQANANGTDRERRANQIIEMLKPLVGLIRRR